MFFRTAYKYPMPILNYTFLYTTHGLLFLYGINKLIIFVLFSL